MKKILVIFSLLVFVGVYTVPAITMPKDVAAKIVAVDKDKKVKASKADVKNLNGQSCCAGTKAGCCDPAKADCCKNAKVGCCDPTKADCCKDGKAGCCEGAKGSCCGVAAASCCGVSTTSCCTGTEGFTAACATACKGAASIKGTTTKAEEKK
ncbi:MAG: hypothetical protein D4R64_04070 [Porphyromonadaceae bacterium]|nr:MAG: hypothetical protein D4R64_04070 [Porphyromonadaceae bacterium]